MGPKTLISLIAVFVLLNLFLFFIINGGNLLKPSTKAPAPSLQKTQNTLELPIALTQQGVESVSLSYNFKGIIKEVQTLGTSSARLKLDIADGNLPDFIITEETTINKIENGKYTLATIAEIKLNSSATLGMIYDIQEKKWRLWIVYFTPLPK